MAQQRCPVCHHDDTISFIEIEDLPIHCNLLWPSRAAALHAPKGDIRLNYCQVCGMIYNWSFDPRRMQYTQAYENSLFFSPHFQGYAQEQAAQLIERYQLRDKNILEIGCGKGEFLSLLCQGRRNRGVGFDPTYDGRGADSETITVIRDFYSEAYAAYAADFICCRQVLEHIQHPRDFLRQLRQTIGDRQNTVVFFEVPNVLYSIHDLGIWDIIYEHCSYFSAPSLTYLFQATGFTVLRVYATFGDQYLCLEAVPAREASDRSWEMSEEVRQMSIDVVTFGENYRNKVKTWHENLDHLFATGNGTVLWGAGSKGVTFLNTVPSSDQVRYVVDISPQKQGMYVPGTGQQVVAPEFMRTYQPDTVLIMNPIYQEEIRILLKEVGVEADVVAV